MLNSGMFTSDTSEWATPQDFFDKLNAEFHFTLDPCATPENAKCGKFYTKEQNGLAQDWTGETVFCNPPYGKEISAWVEKCYKHSLSGECAVMLIPSRTDTRWFHEWVYGKAELRFVKGRLRFNDSKGSAPFPSLVVVYRGATHDEKLPPAQLSTDLISRQAAISAICNACGKIDCDKMDKCEKLQLPPANCSEIPNNSDTISRQAAIDALQGRK